MSLDETAQIDGNWLVIVTLIAIWTSMTVLARRDLVKVSVRAQRIAVTLAVGVTAALLTLRGHRSRPRVQLALPAAVSDDRDSDADSAGLDALALG